MPNFRERMKAELVVLDGAMGSQIIAGGATAGVCNDYLNVESPELIGGIHDAYFAAGSDAVITNTFGANAISLARHGYEQQAVRINTAAAQIARQAAERAGGDRYVLGNIGPCGDFLEPLGQVSRKRLTDAFAEQAGGLVDGGVDGFIIETMTAVDEMVVAVEAVKSVSDLPVLTSFAYDPTNAGFRTMMGAGPEDTVKVLCDVGIDAIGFNCGTLTMEEYVGLAKVYAAAIAEKGVILLAEPNAGRPELVDGNTVYRLSGEDFAAECEKIRDAGARLIGGCCGTTPEHIEAMAKRLRG